MSQAGTRGNKTSRGKRSWLRVLIAIGAVVFVHVLLFGMLKVEPPDQKVRHRTWPKVYLFPIDEPPATRVQRDLLAWIDLLDPTVLSLPSENRGFSRVRRGEFVPPLQDAKMWTVTIGRADIPTLREQVLTEPQLELAAMAARLHAAAPPDLPRRARYVAPKLDPGVYWVLPSGDLLLEPPDLDVPAAGAVVQGPTILSATHGSGLVRARVETSCGDRVLDLAALSAFRKWLGISGKNLAGGVKADKDGVLSVSVQWRFAAGVELAQPPMDTPLWNGEDWRDLHWH